MTIQAVFFDMGGTIETCYHDPELRMRATPGLELVLQRAGVDPGLKTHDLCNTVVEGLARYKRWCMQSLIELPAETVWREFILTNYPVDEQQLAAAAEDLAYYVETRYFFREMRPEMPQVVQALQRMGLRLGVISNILSQGQVPGNLEKYGLLGCFDPIVLSSVYGRRKPDPAIFHHAASKMGVPTSACVYVGDRIDRDIRGAQRAGYRMTFHVRNGADRENEGGPAPDVVLGNMLDMIPVLESELARPRNTRHARISDDVRAILFDAGDLLYYRPREGQRFESFLSGLGLALPAGFHAQVERLKTTAFRGVLSQDSYREALVRFCGVEGQEEVEAGKRILAEEDNDVHFFEGVKDTLLALKERGFLMGIVTDTAHPVSVKLRWFEAAGFGHVWDAFTASRDVGVCKPDPRIYAAALHQLGVEPRQAVFVGHKASELGGAKALGLTTITFNRDADAEGDINIEHFSELLDISLLSG